MTFAWAQIVLGIVSEAVKLLMQLRTTAAQTGEWTEAQAKEFDDNLEKALSGEDPVWKVEPDPTDEAPPS